MLSGWKKKVATRLTALSVFEDRSILVDEFQGLNLLIFMEKKTKRISVYDRLVEGTVVDFDKNLSNEYATDNTTSTMWDLRSGIGVKGSMKDKYFRKVSFVSVYWFVWVENYPETELFSSW
ncbi:MAG: DUF3179 domain-containing protein [Planctomycetes bacterium]|nr:DUF3179 domain-containing protein [Planctomycetota bacterium]